MSQGKTNILVYAHWKGMQKPKQIGILSAQKAKGRKAFNVGEYFQLNTISMNQIIEKICEEVGQW